jgi:hypothetical protein
MTSVCVCPTCGSAHLAERRARQVWSNRMQRYVRVWLTAAEWERYKVSGVWLPD